MIIAAMRALETVSDLDDAIRRSHDHPIVIFKHSSTCGTSAMAMEEVRDLIGLEPAAEVFVVTVQFGRDVSKEIERRFILRHESPQALIVRDGVVRWHASHFRVTRDKIAAALAGVTPQRTA